MQNLKECVFIDGIRTPNARAHPEKGWFRNRRPDELLGAVLEATFERNPKVKPEDLDGFFVGSANLSGMQNEIARFTWLAYGYPESVPTQSVSNQCPSGMCATMNAARAIITGEADIMLAAGCEDMEKVGMGSGMDFPPRLGERYNMEEVMMGQTAEAVAEQWDISMDDMNNFAIHSHKNAAKARDNGNFAKEIIPVKGIDEEGKEITVDRDQWIRDSLDPEKMKAMQSPFKENGRVTAATSSPLTAGACGLLMMSREKADKLGLSYTHKYSFGSQAGNDPKVMGLGPIYSIKKLFEKTGLTPADIGPIEINEAFASQSLACIRDLKLDNDNAPFERVNVWGGAMALGHPLGESGARIIVTLLNILKTDFSDAKYGLASLCGGFGNSNAVLIEKVS